MTSGRRKRGPPFTGSGWASGRAGELLFVEHFLGPHVGCRPLRNGPRSPLHPPLPHPTRSPSSSASSSPPFQGSMVWLVASAAAARAHCRRRFCHWLLVVAAAAAVSVCAEDRPQGAENEISAARGKGHRGRARTGGAGEPP